MDEKEKAKFFDRGLPKWPAFVVSGKAVTKEQAAEIIVRTDGWHLSGNDQQWSDSIHKMIGVETDDHGWAKKWEDMDKFREAHGVLSNLEYLGNRRIYSAWIGGSHGWCDWDGSLFTREYNIGKWPEVEAVYNEWAEIATAFPYLDLRCQLYNGETSEDVPIVLVVEYVIKEGEVTVVEPGAEIQKPSFDTSRAVSSVVWNRFDRERGCNLDQLREALNIVRRSRGLDPLP